VMAYAVVKATNVVVELATDALPPADTER
jgi:hypothetical protein